MMRQCTKVGTMSRCKELVYEEGEETFCYYHKKVRDGVIIKATEEAQDFV